MADFSGSIWFRSTLSVFGGLLKLFVAGYLLFPGFVLTAQTAHYSGAQRILPSSATYPYGVTVDARRNVWVVDNFGGTVSEVTPSGSAWLTVDGGAVVTGLNRPWGIAVDLHGNLYVTEEGEGGGGNDVIKETLVSGPSGNAYTRSVLPASGLKSPYGIAVDIRGNLYIADGANDRVVVETPAGSGYTQSTLPTTSLSLPMGVAVDAGGSVYIADYGNRRVVKETPSGTRYVESVIADHLAKTPIDVSVDASGTVYVLAYTRGGEAGDYVVVKETPSHGAYTQSAVGLAPPQNPYGMAVDARGDIYAASPGLNRLVQLATGAGDFGPVNVGTTALPISLLFTLDSAGSLGSPAVLTEGLIGFDFSDARTGTCTTHGGDWVYAAGDFCSVDVRFKPEWAGPRYGGGILQGASGSALASAYVHGSGVAPQISFLPARRVLVKNGLANPFGVAVDPKGEVFFAESGSGTVNKETRSGNSYVLATVAAGLSHPTQVVEDGKGNLYIAATDTVYKETPEAGNYRQSAIFTNPGELTGMAVDGSGNVYFTSSASGDVHKETLKADGRYVETAMGFGITHPAGVALDGLGNVFIADPGQGDVYRETLEVDGSYRQRIVASGLAAPDSVGLDGGGNVYVVASGNGDVYKEALQADGTYVQTIPAAGLEGPRGIALDTTGNLYVSLDATGEVVMIDVADPPVLDFRKTAVGSTSADSPQLVTVSNIGNAPLVFAFHGTGPNPALSTGFSLDSSTTCPEISASGPNGTFDNVDAGASCGYAITFTPVVPGPVRGTLGLLDNNLNQAFALAKQSIELREGITSDATRTSVRATPDEPKLGLGVTITVTVSDTSIGSLIPQGGGVTLTDTIAGKAMVLHGGAPLPLVNGEAILTMIPKVAGEHTISAHYSGVNASFASSTGEAFLDVLK